MPPSTLLKIEISYIFTEQVDSTINNLSCVETKNAQCKVFELENRSRLLNTGQWIKQRIENVQLLWIKHQLISLKILIT